MKVNDQQKYEAGYFKIHRFTVAALSGITGAQNILFAKSISTLMIVHFSENGNFFVCLETYIIILCLVGSIFFQLRWLNSGLSHFSALHIIPVFQAFWILFGVIGGLVVFGEYQQMKGFYERLYFGCGVFITICGVLYLVLQEEVELKKTKKKEKEN